jgi:hypothetical protein
MLRSNREGHLTRGDRFFSSLSSLSLIDTKPLSQTVSQFLAGVPRMKQVFNFSHSVISSSYFKLGNSSNCWLYFPTQSLRMVNLCALIYYYNTTSMNSSINWLETIVKKNNVISITQLSGVVFPEDMVQLSKTYHNCKFINLTL